MNISLVMCTHNPSRNLLERSLNSVRNQDILDDEIQFVVVDNCSEPPLESEVLRQLSGRDVTLVRESRPGLVFARVAAFKAAQHEVVVFIDDDNELSPDYLRRASEIAALEPDLGVFGGKCLGAFEQPPTSLKRYFLPFLGVRDVGEQALTGEGDAWGVHEPIGAGIVVRREVGDLYVRFVEREASGAALGRVGTTLLAGEDSLISRLAHRLGLRSGYRPDLQLRHHIAPARLGWRYLGRLMRGHGTSYVRLARIQGQTFPRVKPGRVYWIIVANALSRLRKQGAVATIAHVFWDLGYYDAVNGDVPSTHRL